MPVIEMVNDYLEETKDLTYNQLKIKEVKDYIETLDKMIESGNRAKKKKAEWENYLISLQIREKVEEHQRRNKNETIS